MTTPATMTTSLQFAEASAFSTPLLAVMAVDASAGDAPTPTLLAAPGLLDDRLAQLVTAGEFAAKPGETLLLHAPAGLGAQRLLVVGLGKAAKADAGRVRQAAGTAVRTAMAKSVAELSFVLPDERALAAAGVAPLVGMELSRAAAEGAVLASIDFDVYKTDRKDRTPTAVTLLADQASQGATRDALLLGVTEGTAIAEAANFARLLVNEPGNVLTPVELGRRTAAMAERVGLQCEVHSTAKLEELKMGAFLAVAQGSAEQPALIVLRYEPDEAVPADAPLLTLVGKGISFDTGGISIKPADGMEKMKNDMGGAATMIGTMQAIAALKPRVRVMAVICSAENMPDGKAYRPGDVLTAMSGKTIEVMNTDAEGRLVLADGLHYAKTLGATHLVDAATLTGACVVALGRLNAGLFANDEAVCERFLQSMRAEGESFWRLPCTEEYAELIKSQIADIQNTGVDRWGGAITAAMFLKEFVGETPWIHLDIAGQVNIDDVRPYIAKGPSGVGVRTLVAWLRSFEQRA